jgi:hypothetical protein
MSGTTEWLGLIGVGLGGVLGYTSSAIQEHLRRRHDDSRLEQSQAREDRVRLENRRFDAYTALITSANRVHAAAKYPTLAADPSAHAGKRLNIIEPVAYSGQLNISYESFNAALSPAFLLADSEDVRASLRMLTTATLKLTEGARTAVSDQHHRIEMLAAEQRKSLRAAESAMRREIGLEPLPLFS